MPSIRLPLATTFLNRKSSVDKDSKIVNGYIEKYTEDHSAVVKRPGLSFYQSGNTGCGQGFYTDNNGTLYTASNNIVADQVSPNPGSAWVETTINAFTAGSGLGRTNGASVVFNNKLWYFGGQQSDLTSTNEVYNSSDGITWNLVTTINCWPARYSHTATVFNNKIFIIGGLGVSSDFNDVWSSIDGITWVLEAANGNPQFSGVRIERHSATVFNSQLFVLGGVSGGARTNDIWSSLDGAVWAKISTTTIWPAREAHASLVYNNKLWVMGGDSSISDLNDVWNSSDGVTWTQVTSTASWSARHGLTVDSFCNYMFLLGGTASATAQNDVWKSLDGITWTQVTQTSPTSSHGSHGSAVFFGSLWVIAGTGGVPIGEVWRTLGDVISLGTSCETLSFQQTSSSASTKYIMIKSNTLAYLFNTATKFTSKIIDINYPATTVPGIVFLDGYFFVMTPTGEIHNSALEDPTTWGSLDFITAEMEPDSGVAIAKHLNYLVAFGSYTTEFFYDAANALGSPLARVDNAMIFYGCASGYSVVHMNNTLVWMSVTQQKGRQIAVMNGFAPMIISTPFVERILAADDLATVYAFNTKVNGHDFYVLTLKTSNITLAYDFVTKTWFQWTSMRVQASKSVTSVTLGTDGVTVTATVTAHGYADGDRITIAGATQTAYNGNFNITYVDANTFTYQVTGTPASPATGTITAVGYTEGYFRGIAGSVSNGVNLVQDETTGDLYKIDMSNYDDTTGYINFLTRTTNFDAGSMNTKYPARLEMIGDKETNSHLLVRYSNDDYVTYSKYRKLDLSKKRSRLNRLGSFKRRSFDLRHTDATPLRLEQIEMEIDKEGT